MDEENNDSTTKNDDNKLTTPLSDDNIVDENEASRFNNQQRISLINQEFRQPIDRPKNSKFDMGTQYEIPRDDWMLPEDYYETQITDIHYVKKKKKKPPPSYEVYTQTEKGDFKMGK